MHKNKEDVPEHEMKAVLKFLGKQALSGQQKKVGTKKLVKFEDAPPMVEGKIVEEQKWFDALAALEVAERAEQAAQEQELAALRLTHTQRQRAYTTCPRPGHWWATPRPASQTKRATPLATFCWPARWAVATQSKSRTSTSRDTKVDPAERICASVPRDNPSDHPLRQEHQVRRQGGDPSASPCACHPDGNREC